MAFKDKTVSAKSVAVEITAIHRRTGASTTFYYSTDGLITEPGDTPANQYFAPRLIKAVDITEQLFSGTGVGGRSSIALGTITLDNSDGGLDDWEDYSVDGSQIVVKVGERNASYSTYTTILTIQGRRVFVNQDVVEIKVSDKQFKLDRAISTNIYGGRESALWFDNDVSSTNKRRVTAEVPNSVSFSSTNVTFEFWLYFDGDSYVFDSADVFTFFGLWDESNPVGSMNCALFPTSPGDDIVFAIRGIEGSATLAQTWTLTLSEEDSISGATSNHQNTNKWIHISFSHDDDKNAQLLINGKLVTLSGESYSASSSVGTTGTLDIGHSDDVTLFFGDCSFGIDDLRIYEENLSVEDRQSRWYRPLTVDESARTWVYYKFDDAQGNTATDSGPNGLDGTLTGSSGLPVWISALDGGPELTGKSKPLTYGGICFNVPFTFIGVLDDIYQCHDGQLSSIETIYDGGNALTKAASQPSTFFDFIDTTSTPADGEWWEWLNLGMIRLGAPPAKDVTGDIKGDVDSDGTFNNDLASIIEEISLTKGGLSAGEIDTSGSFVEFGQEPFVPHKIASGYIAYNPTGIGIHIPTGSNDKTIASVFDDLCSSVSGYWYFNPSGLLKIGILGLPLDSTVLDINVNTHSFSFKRLESQLPAWKLSVPYRRNFKIQNFSDLVGVASTADGSIDPLVSSTRAELLKQPFSQYEIQDVSILDIHPAAETLPAQGGGLVVSSSSINSNVSFVGIEASRRFKLFGRIKEMYSINILGLLAMNVQLGETVGITHDRFSLDGGVLDKSLFLYPYEQFIVIRKKTNFSRNNFSVELVVWSPEKAFRYTSDGRKRVPKGMAVSRKGGIQVA